ncbi:PucR family transcriptional regulator [Gordonia sp. KTR9]|uniref:PucR family transcriptional regulator n=1 Tax=Gordonia sp. KTR9 TaxID=337191 RepID=UPI00027DE778|nr:helix-turn-helix domain-containing protein [Gordonia sp. KTR9]AFR50969.1 transcriptional regulator, CdaR [Gordonia sp. KTR9]
MRASSQAQLIADLLYSQFDTPILITAGMGTILAFSHQPPEASDALRRGGILLNNPSRVPEWLQEYLDPALGLVRTPENKQIDALPRTIISIPYRGHPIGYIFALDPDQRIPSDWHVVNQRTLISVGLEIELQKSRASQSQLAVRSALSPDPAIRSVGVDSLRFMRAFENAGRIRVLVSEFADDTAAHLTRIMWDGPPGGDGAWAAIDERLVIVVNEDERSSDKEIDRLSTILKQSSPPPVVFFGIGGEVDGLDSARQSYEEGLAALRVGKLLSERPTTSRWDDLGSWRSLATLGRDRGKRTLDPRVGRLVAEERAEMVDVLREYLNRNGEVDRIAADFHMHRSTVYSRLKKIESKYGLDLSDAEDRLTITIGLRLAQLYL